MENAFIEIKNEPNTDNTITHRFLVSSESITPIKESDLYYPNKVKKKPYVFYNVSTHKNKLLPKFIPNLEKHSYSVIHTDEKTNLTSFSPFIKEKVSFYFKECSSEFIFGFLTGLLIYSKINTIYFIEYKHRIQQLGKKFFVLKNAPNIICKYKFYNIIEWLYIVTTNPEEFQKGWTKGHNLKDIFDVDTCHYNDYNYNSVETTNISIDELKTKNREYYRKYYNSCERYQGCIWDNENIYKQWMEYLNNQYNIKG